MRRADVIGGIEEVLEALRVSKIGEALAGVAALPQPRTGLPREVAAALLSALRLYTIEAQHFSPATKRVAEILGLGMLEDSNVWVELLSADPSGGALAELNRSIGSASRDLPNLLGLLRQVLGTVQGNGRAGLAPSAGMSILSVVVIEDEPYVSSPQRLVNVLQSVYMLYDACAEMTGAPSVPLGVAGCDSGGDKSFDFLGTAAVMECVQEVILSIWYRMVFYRERAAVERMQLVADSLPILERIARLEREQTLAPERAQLLRQRVVEGAGKFMAAGAMIPEVERQAYHDPRLLMAPLPRFLLNPLAANAGDGGRTRTDGGAGAGESPAAAAPVGEGSSADMHEVDVDTAIESLAAPTTAGEGSSADMHEVDIDAAIESLATTAPAGEGSSADMHEVDIDAAIESLTATAPAGEGSSADMHEVDVDAAIESLTAAAPAGEERSVDMRELAGALDIDGLTPEQWATVQGLLGSTQRRNEPNTPDASVEPR